VRTYCGYTLLYAAIYETRFCTPGYLAGVVSLVALFLATERFAQPTRRPARPCVCRSLEREAKPPRRREQLTRPKAPLKTLYNGLHQKGGNEYYIYSSFCFIEIKTLNHRKRDSTSHINIIVREINN
jgi:hypothetical protein